MNRILDFSKNNGDNRVKGLHPDERKVVMQMKAAQQAREQLHKTMMDEIQKLVPSWRRKLCRVIFPRWLNNMIVHVLNVLPPAVCIRWAMSPGRIHMAYKWFLLLPMVIPNSLIRTLIVFPLNFLTTRVWVFGITRSIQPIDKFVNEMTIRQRGGPILIFRQDWRNAKVQRVGT